MTVKRLIAEAASHRQAMYRRLTAHENRHGCGRRIGECPLRDELEFTWARAYDFHLSLLWLLHRRFSRHSTLDTNNPPGL